MSVTTWKKKHYKVPADSVSKDKALAHSIAKWEGFTSSALKSHHITMGDLANEGIGYYSRSCAVCQHHLEDKYDIAESPRNDACQTCPIARVRGGIRCDRRMPHERYSPHFSMENEGNPIPMLAWMRLAQEMIKQNVLFLDKVTL